MKCDPKTMVKAAVALGAAIAAAYFAFPAARALILASAPILLALVCPVAMLVMMYSMKGGQRSEANEDTKPVSEARSVDPERAGPSAPR